MYIDTHVHLRDFEERHKETIKHGLEVAYDSGVDAVFDMPNTKPLVITEEVALSRIRAAREARMSDVFYGLYMGVTNDPEQLKRAVDAYRRIPQIVGLKMFTAHSVGDLSVIWSESQVTVYRILVKEGYDGVLALHCEDHKDFQPDIWDPKDPQSHCYTRPEITEITSVENQIHLAHGLGFAGKLHIAHISSPKAVDVVEVAKTEGVDVSCGICPHHFIYDWNQMNKENGILWKMNPPLRSPESRSKLFQQLKDGKIDWIETDHAPHALHEKLDEPYMSGIPGLAWWPLFEKYLLMNDFTNTEIEKLTFTNAAKRFGLEGEIQRSRREIRDRRGDYPFDPYKRIAKELGWPN